MIANIQILRAIAAFMVVFHHVLFFSKDFYPIGGINFGSAGVDIFFVISGFIMVHMAGRRSQTPGAFLRNRILRIVPLYWFVTLFVIFLTLLRFTPLGLAHWSAADLFSSLFFIPEIQGGVIKEPIVFVGWSLNYEMFFYLCFGLSLFLRSTALSVISLAGLFVAIYAAGRFLPSAPAMIGYYGNPIILEFVSGCLIGLAYARLPERLSASARFAAAALGLIGFLLIVLGDTRLADFVPQIAERRLLLAGIPAAMIVAAALILERTGTQVNKPFLLLQGAASYSIYLIHPLVLQMLFKAAAKLMPVPGALAMGLTVLVSLVAVCVVGTLMHLLVERPMTTLLSGRIAFKTT